MESIRIMLDGLHSTAGGMERQGLCAKLRVPSSIRSDDCLNRQIFSMILPRVIKPYSKLPGLGTSHLPLIYSLHLRPSCGKHICHDLCIGWEEQVQIRGRQ